LLLITRHKTNIKKFPFLPIGLVVLSVFIFFFLVWCNACKKTDETGVIREQLQSLAVLAEKKNRAKIIEQLDKDYRDFEERDTQQTDSLLEYYFKNYQGIAIHMLDVYVDIDEGQAEAQADVLLSSGPLENLRKLVGLVGVYYRFDFRLAKKDGRWKITYAAWREIDSDSLLPGSRIILKKIFGD